MRASWFRWFEIALQHEHAMPQRASPHPAHYLDVQGTAHAQVAETLAFSPASSMLLTARLTSQLAGIIWFPLLSPRGQHTFTSRRTIIRKRHVSAMTAVTWTCRSKY